MSQYCKKCKIETERNVSGACKPCQRASVAKYRAANREKVASKNAKWYAANRKKIRTLNAKWQTENRDKVIATNAKCYAANAEKRRAYAVNYRAENTDKCRVLHHNRRARERENGGTLSSGLSDRLFKLQKGKCPCCSQPLGDDYHLDHIVPIKLGGSNTDDNIQLLRGTCNHQKSAKHPVDFMQSRGFLL